MRRVFADTFYWIALVTPREAEFAAANDYSGDLVTTDEVLTEFLTYFSSSRQMRGEACGVVDDILADPTIKVIQQSRASFLAGLDLYRARPDKGYSLVDCISMQTMRSLGLVEVLTNDRHFEQEGFRRLFGTLH